MITHTIQDCKEELKKASLKVTPARLAVLKILEKKDKPLDAGTIQSSLQTAGVKINPVTVFRILNHFKTRGLARLIQFNEGKVRYESTSRGDHHHLICQKCRSIENFGDCSISKLEQEINRKKQFIVASHSLEFFGFCKKCQR